MTTSATTDCVTRAQSYISSIQDLTVKALRVLAS